MPLTGIRVLDFGRYIAGPYLGALLADYGAEVIKVEPPGGDSTRHTGPAPEPGMAAMFLGSNRSKKSIALDLKRPEARQALDDIALRHSWSGRVIHRVLRVARTLADLAGPDVLTRDHVLEAAQYRPAW